MPLDPGTTGQAPLRRKRKKRVAPGVARAEGTGVGAPKTPYRPPPNPVLQQFGIRDDIFTVNRKVERITDAFERRFQYRPPPALVFDLLRAPLSEDDYEGLFDVPQTGVGRTARMVRANAETMGVQRAEEHLPFHFPPGDEGGGTFREAIDPWGPWTPDAGLDAAIYEAIGRARITRKAGAAEVPPDVVHLPPQPTPASTGGGEPGRPGFRRPMVDTKALQNMERVWAVVGPKYFPGQEMPIPVFVPGDGGMAHAAAWVAPDENGYDIVHWPEKITKQLASGEAMSVATLLHEWAHVFQVGVSRGVKRFVEGGATAFSDQVLPVVLKELRDLGIDERVDRSDDYSRWAKQVKKKRGKEFVLWEQFGGKDFTPFSQVEAQRLARRPRDPSMGVLRAEGAGIPEGRPAAETDPWAALQPPDTMGPNVLPIRLAALTAAQLGEAFVHFPAGLYVVGREVGFDVRDFVARDERDFKRTEAIARLIASEIKHQYQNPLENPGFIFLDVLGLVAVPGSVAGRAAAASKVAKAGGTKRQVATAAVRRPEGGTFNLGGEEVILTENTSARAVQKVILEKRRRRMEGRQAAQPDSIERLSRTHRAAGTFSAEAKVGREARARQRVEHTVAMTIKRELDQASDWSFHASLSFKQMPVRVSRPLKRGEQKAIQVLATDEPGGWQAKLAVHQSFHQRMLSLGVGDAKAHTRQLADLELARKAFENPSPRLSEAFELTRKVIQEQELIKVERLGLDAATARQRVAAFGEVLRRADKKGVPLDLEKLDPDSFYLPSTLTAKSRVPVSERVPTARPGRFGIPEPRGLPELGHVFTGNSIRWGDTRIDATHLAGESYARAVRSAAVVDEHKRLLAQATDKKKSEFDIPIRESSAIPDELREIVNQIDEGTVSPKDLDGLSPDFQSALYEHLFPKTNVEGIKWVDERVIGDAYRYPNQPGFGTTLATAVNEPARTLILFARPAYSLNLLGNAMMMAVQQGPYAPATMFKALRANKTFGGKVTRTLESLGGEGKALSFAPDELLATRASRTLAVGWNALVDQKMRLAAIIYEAERKGYKSKDDMNRLLFSKEGAKDRVEISRRGNKAMVEFNNLTPFEKNTLRHWVFVYPWVSRSIVWSLRTMVEHPYKTWGIAELGAVGEKYVEDEMPKTPEWFNQVGYFPINQDDEGRPRVVNPMSVSTFSSMSEAILQAQGLFTDVPYVAPEELLGPAAEFGLRFATSQDPFGREYETGAVIGSVRDLIGGLPQSAAVKRRKAIEDEDPSKRPSFLTGAEAAWGPLIAGGLWPRTADMEALEARWRRDLPTEERQSLSAKERAEEIRSRLAVERRAIWEAEKVTATVLGQSLPDPVRQALTLQMRFAEDYAEFAIETGRQATAAEKRELQIDRLMKAGRISLEQGVALREELGSARRSILGGPRSGADYLGDEKLSAFTRKLNEDYLFTKDLAQWHSDRDTVLDFAANAGDYLAYLRNKGLFKGNIASASKAGNETLWKVGREFLAYDKEARARAKEGAERSEVETLRSAEKRAWVDAQDSPIRSGGSEYPSPVRLGWAMLPAEQKLAKLAAMTTTSWESLSDFEKELLGRKPAPKTSYGWVVYSAITDALRGNVSAADVAPELRDALPPASGSGRVMADERVRVAKYVDRHFAKGFFKDFIFAEEPKYRRLERVATITKSKHAKDWQAILSVANEAWRYRRDAPNKTVADEEWRAYVKDTLMPWIEQEKPAGFKDELELLGGLDLLQTWLS